MGEHRRGPDRLQEQRTQLVVIRELFVRFHEPEPSPTDGLDEPGLLEARHLPRHGGLGDARGRGQFRDGASFTRVDEQFPEQTKLMLRTEQRQERRR